MKPDYENRRLLRCLQKQITDEVQRHLEEIQILGYTILKDVLNDDKLQLVRKKIDEIYQEQQTRLGEDYLKKIQETNLIRCPLAYDDLFLQIAANPVVLDIVKNLIGEYVMLHQQNAIINPSKEKHHQSAWHRDLPYQDWVISKPIASSALFCIDDFTKERGSTHAIPYSHKLDHLPSTQYVESHHHVVEAPAGCVVVFDSMLFHRAGYNTSDHVRRAINKVYAVPLLKQQIDLPDYLAGKYSDNEFFCKFLGYEAQVPKSDEQFKQKRAAKLRTQN